ncbi:MAG: hypothetical protein KGH54_03570 [Candidatus Micrarchaeota archaeon]|nr:hypothetical protein [Candidatus Micrarchaeota archaeon]
MEGLARHKVPGGKLVTVKIKFGERIDSIQILGDFFLHPEDSLEKIEKSLEGMEITSSESELSKRIAEIAQSEKIEMIGVTPQSIAQTIIMAVKK